MFESSVNSEGIETLARNTLNTPAFESSVNSEGIETAPPSVDMPPPFESSVNSEGIETDFKVGLEVPGLRAV